MSGTILAKTIFDTGNYRTSGELPAVGSRAPDIMLVNTKLQNVSLANWMGKRKIMNILISIDTTICAKSVMEFDRIGADYDDIAMLMVSYDLPFAQARFAEEFELDNVTFLSAIRHAGFGENYGVQITEGPLAGMFTRAVVVLDENNTVVHREHIRDVGSEPDYAAAFRALGVRIEDAED